MHIGIYNDMLTTKKNIEAGRKLCKRCGGSGNELYSMYRRCTHCYGRGYFGPESPTQERLNRGVD